jgi:hypothetical protein
MNMLSRRTPIRVVIGILILAFAVFGWGLQYKLSLYEPDSVSTQIPHAKLLSPKERPVSTIDLNSVLPASPQPKLAIFPIFLIAAIVLGSHFVVSSWSWSVAKGIDSCRQRRANSNYFSFRPPPVLLPAN